MKSYTPSRRILAISKSDVMKCNQIVLVLFAILMETARGDDAEVKAQLQLVEKTIVQVGSKIIDLERKNEELEQKVSHQSSENVELRTEIQHLKKQLVQTESNISAANRGLFMFFSWLCVQFCLVLTNFVSGYVGKTM